jgi:hypothetical protein
MATGQIRDIEVPGQGSFCAVLLDAAGDEIALRESPA